MIVSDDIFYVGVNDHQVDLFEGQYPVKNGMSYNSYVIADSRVAVLDTAEQHFGDQWLRSLRSALAGRTPDDLIISHMEPDHSAQIAAFLKEYPDTRVVASQKAFQMMAQFFGAAPENRLMVRENDTLDLGHHVLQFIMAPMVHWPEVMMTYDQTSGTLFSADAFGTFGVLDAQGQDWADEARRYYIGIVGKYGVPVQTVLKKAAKLDIRRICPLHGPVLTDEIPRAIGLYDTWSSYQPEEKGVTIAFTSIYGHTREAAMMLRDLLDKRGIRTAAFDLARDDMFAAVASAFRYDKLVLATTTYNGGIFPFMRTFIDHLTERGYKNHQIALMENGTWAPMAAKTMARLLEEQKGITILDAPVTILSALDEKSAGAVKELAERLCE